MDRSNDKIPKVEWAIADKLAREGDRVRRRNERFAGMTPEQKRVEVARDVLALLKEHGIRATDAMYCAPTYEWPAGALGVEVDACDVCALGGLLVAATARGATGETEHDLHARVYNGDNTYRALGALFSEEQMQLVETAYECIPVRRNLLTEDQVAAAKEFGSRYDDRSKRLATIMRNIIRNGGEFMP